MTAAALSLDDVIAADRLFFEQHVDRHHRIRLAEPVEVADPRHHGDLRIPPLGLRWHIAVRQTAPNARLRVLFAAPPEFHLDRSEHDCRRLFRHAAGREWCLIGDRMAAAYRIATRAAARC